MFFHFEAKVLSALYTLSVLSGNRQFELSLETKVIFISSLLLKGETGNETGIRYQEQEQI